MPARRLDFLARHGQHQIPIATMAALAVALQLAFLAGCAGSLERDLPNWPRVEGDRFAYAINPAFGDGVFDPYLGHVRPVCTAAVVVNGHEAARLTVGQSVTLRMAPGDNALEIRKSSGYCANFGAMRIIPDRSSLFQISIERQ